MSVCYIFKLLISSSFKFSILSYQPSCRTSTAFVETETSDPDTTDARATTGTATTPDCQCNERVTSSTTLRQLVKVLLLITLCSSLVSGGMTKRARKSSHGKHFVIHVPLKIRTHHHMHTVYTRVHGKGSVAGSDSSTKAAKQTIYKIMGYSTHHTSAGPGGGGGGGGSGPRGFAHGHGYGHAYKPVGGHRGGGGGYGEINYDDYTNSNCDGDGGGGGGDDSMAHGDMIFNHFARQDEEYPEELEEELIEDEREDEDEGDEWE